MVTRADTSKMTPKEKAVHDLKWKLAHGAEGTALIAGLTVALKGALGAAGWTAKNVLGPPLKEWETMSLILWLKLQPVE